MECLAVRSTLSSMCACTVLYALGRACSCMHDCQLFVHTRMHLRLHVARCFAQALVSSFNDLVAFNTEVGGTVCAAVVIEIVQANVCRTSMRLVLTAPTLFAL